MEENTQLFLWFSIYIHLIQLDLDCKVNVQRNSNQQTITKFKKLNVFHVSTFDMLNQLSLHQRISSPNNLVLRMSYHKSTAI